MGSPFFMWTIVQAWDWLIHLPVLGFIALIYLEIKAGDVVIGVIRSGYLGWIKAPPPPPAW